MNSKKSLNLLYFDLSPQQVGIFKNILGLIPEERPLIVGINGFDASGKTEFSKRLQFFLHQQDYTSHIIHLDDFHNHLAKRREGPNENQAYIDNAFNVELLSSLLREIGDSKSLQRDLKLLDLETDTYTLTRTYDVDQNSIILVEGVLLFRPPVNQYFDFRIYLDVSVGTLLERNISRASDSDPIEVEKRYRSKYLQINEWYYKTYKPAESSDIVIDNENYRSPLVKS